jgi:hypothetical protein
MCAVLVVVANILREPAFQVAFVNCDDVIQEITPAAPYPATPFCQGLSNEVRRAFTLKDRTAAGTSSPYLASRSKMTNLGAHPNENASRNCCTIHELVGCFVILKCRIRRSGKSADSASFMSYIIVVVNYVANPNLLSFNTNPFMLQRPVVTVARARSGLRSG